ncbi:MAG: beta-galactosidase [Clostridiales bacterium]
MYQFPKIMYGGDYNPDQWSESIWDEDIRLFKLANIDIVTLPVFSWAKLQPSEDSYNFGWLDKIMEKMASNNIKVCCATSTAAQPSWMSKKFPDVLPVDINGIKRKHGGRTNFCPNSKNYRKFSVRLATKLSERYKNNPSLLVWHIGNEYINICYCENCAKAFRKWLKQKYKNVEEVNKKWNMNFWGHTIYSWDEIDSVSNLTEMGRDTFSGHDRDITAFQGMALDYKRFMSDSVFECYLGEYNAIKKLTPNIPITTNLMGFFKPLNYQKWSKKMDIISLDNYPYPNEDSSIAALKHSLMRGLKNGEPFMFMEQSPSQVNWQPVNSLKKPGVMRLQSYQAIAHGSETVMFFQLRRSLGACEKLHGAVIDHVGHENTRVFRECSHLGKELTKLGDKISGSRIYSKVAILIDWENWWAVEYSSGLTIHLNYINQIEKYYKTIHNMNISVDIISLEDKFENYDVIISPVLYMIKENVSKLLESYVNNGGTFITTFFSGLVDENDLVTTKGYPGELRKLLGIWVEEIDAILPTENNTMLINEKLIGFKKSYTCNTICDILHLENAKALAEYGNDFYKGMPVLTKNQFGKGVAYYIASDPEEDFLKDFFTDLFSKIDIKTPFTADEGLEITQRKKGSKVYTFILNHNNTKSRISLDDKKYIDLLTDEEFSNEIIIDSKDVKILENKS